MRWPVLLVLVGCGRLGFGDAPASDGPAPDGTVGADAFAGLDFGNDCAVGLKLDEALWTGAPGEVFDSCSHGNNGTAVNAAVTINDPTRGRVGDVPGMQDCVKIPNAPSLHATTGLTMSAWVYPTALDAVDPYGIIAKRNDFTNDDAEYDMFLWTDNTVWVDIDSRNDRAQGVATLVNATWQQVTVTYDGTLPPTDRVNIYIDGVHDVTLPETSATLTEYGSDLSIGCLPELPSTDTQIGLVGRIDDAAVWTRAFTAPQVLAWYTATR